MIPLNLLQSKHWQFTYIFSLLVRDKIDKTKICQIVCFQKRKNEAPAGIWRMDFLNQCQALSIKEVPCMFFSASLLLCSLFLYLCCFHCHPNSSVCFYHLDFLTIFGLVNAFLLFSPKLLVSFYIIAFL